MKKIYKNIIVGSGFSAFVLNIFLKKDFLVVTTDQNFIKKLPPRKYLTPHLRLFYKKYISYGIFKYILHHSTLHDTIIHGGNTNFWGGICNINSLKNKLKILKKIIHFKKINIKETGSYSNNNYLFQMQEKNKNNRSIFNCANYFKNLIYGHLIDFKIEKQNVISLNVKKNKVKKLYCKNLILALNAVQLIEVLINSNIIQDKDKISLSENQFKTKISFRQNLYNQKKNSLIISYSLSGIIKHALGKRENFNKYFFNFFNFFPLFYHQIFYKKKISALYKVEKSNKILKEISEKTEPDFGKSQHYFNMKVNNVEIKKILYKTCKNIHGISSPFIIKKTTPGPIAHCLIEESISLSKKLNKS